MQKQGFFSLFSLLSNKERKLYHQYLASPYFNSRQELVKMGQYLEDLILSKIDEVNKERLFSRIYPNTLYDDLKWRHTASHFKKALEEFLAIEEWKLDKPDQALRLAQSLRKKEANAIYERQLSKSFDLLEKEPYRDLDYHYMEYRLYLEQYEFAHRIRRGGKMYLQEQTDALTLFYMSGVLRQSCIILSHQNLNPRAYDQVLLNSVLQEVENGDYLKHPAISIYYYSLLALQDETNEEAFEKTVDLIFKHYQAFRSQEIRDIFILAINYCIRRLNKGDRSFIRKGFELYQKGLESKSLMDQGYISPFAYKNVLMLGMSLKEHEWVEHFLHTFKKYLRPEIRDNTFNYNLAIYYFRKPDYDQAMDLLQRVDFKDVLNNLDARRMLLRMYYEMGAHEALDSHLDSFRQYIKRQKEIGYHKDSYIQLIKYVKKTLRANLNDKEKRKLLLQEVENAPPFVEKAWLVEQIGPK